MGQLKMLRCELSLQTLRSYASKGLVPKSAREGGGRGAESWWHPETVPEAVAASELLAHQRMNFERVTQIRRMGRHIEKLIAAKDFETALFGDARVRKFLTGDLVTAFRLGIWLHRKWGAMEQLYRVLALRRERDANLRQADTYYQLQVTGTFLIQGFITGDLMDIANKRTKPEVGKLLVADAEEDTEN